MRTFRYNCTRGQLNKEGGGEIHEIKKQNGNRQRKNMIKSKQISFEITRA